MARLPNSFNERAFKNAVFNGMVAEFVPEFQAEEFDFEAFVGLIERIEQFDEMIDKGLYYAQNKRRKK